MKQKSLGQCLSESEDVVSHCPKVDFTELEPRIQKSYERQARLFLRSLRGDAWLAALSILNARDEQTSPAVASKAAKVLRSKKTGRAAKSIAGSALTQARGKRK